MEAAGQILALLQASLDSVLSHSTDPSRRLFWGFMLSSLVLAAAAIVWQERRGGATPWRVLLRRDYWRNPSHLTDIGLLALNTAIKLGWLIPLLGSHLLATIWVARFWQGSFGNAPEFELPWLLVAALFTATFFLGEDFSRFALPLTLHRVHPLEMCLYYLRGLIVFGLVGGTFAYLFGRQLGALEILGVDALGFLFNAAGANLRHSPIWLGFGRLERHFISPAQHQVHHSNAVQDYDTNFGTCLAWWDRAWGSWRASGEPRLLEFGVSKPAVDKGGVVEVPLPATARVTSA